MSSPQRGSKIDDDESMKKDEMLAFLVGHKIEKWQETSPAKQPKSPPITDSKNRKKEKYAITDMPKQFDAGDGLGEGQAGDGKLNVSVGRNKLAGKDAKGYARTDMPKQFGVPPESSLGDGLGKGQAGDAKLTVSSGHNKLAGKDAKVYAITDMPKQFGVPPESFLGDGIGEAQAGSGKLDEPVVKAAPNLCALVGEAVARKLIGTAGGLTELARTPSCNIKFLGTSEENLEGSSNSSNFCVGHIGQTEILQSTPHALKPRVCRLIANKSALAARVDSSGGYENGEYGRELSKNIRMQIEKWREPSPEKQPKFDAGDGLGEGQAGDAKLTVSAGHNKLSAKYAKVYAITDMPKQFGVPPESFLGDGIGEAQAGSGKLDEPVVKAAPNLCALVGEAVARKLIGTAGGLTELARTPSCNIKFLGTSEENLEGSSNSSNFCVGHIGQTEILQSTPHALKPRVCRLIANKSALAARVDSSGGYENGEYGRELSKNIRMQIEKWREPSPEKQSKFDAGDGLGEGQAGDAKLTVSAGHNKLAAKYAKVYAITDMPKQFGVPPESFLGDGIGEAQAGSGKLDEPVVKAAPNLCALVGEAVARKLIGTAGGLTELARTPSCNIKFLGTSEENLEGSSNSSNFCVGHIGQTEILQSTPHALKPRVCRLIANKSALAARVDSSGGYENGEYGRELSKNIRMQIEKWREPSPEKQPKFDAGDGLGEGQAGDAKLTVSAGHNKLAAKYAKVGVSSSIHRH